MYTGMVVANVVLGIIIPVIDNAAHIGGLIAGITMTTILMKTRPNRLQKMSKVTGLVIGGVFVAALTFGVIIGSSANFIKERFLARVDDGESLREKYYFITQAARIDPDDYNVLFRKAKILLATATASATAL